MCDPSVILELLKCTKKKIKKKSSVSWINLENRYFISSIISDRHLEENRHCKITMDFKIKLYKKVPNKILLFYTDNYE